MEFKIFEFENSKFRVVFDEGKVFVNITDIFAIIGYLNCNPIERHISQKEYTQKKVSYATLSLNGYRNTKYHTFFLEDIFIKPQARKLLLL